MTTDAELKPPPLIEQAIADFLGPRCRDFDADCYTCQAWKEYDELRARRPLPSSGDLEVREALKVFAKAADAFNDAPIRDAEQWFIWTRSSNTPKVESLQITVGDLRRARSVLASLQEGGDRGVDVRDGVIDECIAAVRAIKWTGRPTKRDVVDALSALSASPARPGGVGEEK